MHQISDICILSKQHRPSVGWSYDTLEILNGSGWATKRLNVTVVLGIKLFSKTINSIKSFLILRFIRIKHFLYKG